MVYSTFGFFDDIELQFQLFSNSSKLVGMFLEIGAMFLI